MKKISYLFAVLLRTAPFSVLVTVIYYLASAAAPALSTLLYAGIFEGMVLFMKESQAAPLLRYIAGLLLLRLTVYLLNYGYSVLVNTGIFERGSMHFRMELRQKAARLSLWHLEDAAVLDRLKRAEETINEDTLPMLFYQLLEISSAGLSTCLVAAVLWHYHWGLLPAAVLTVLPYPIIHIYRGRRRVQAKNAQANNIRKRDYYWQLLTDKTSIRELRVLNCQSHICDLWRQSSQQTREALLLEKKKDLRADFFGDAIKLLGFFASLFLAVCLVIARQISLSVFGAVISALQNMQEAAKTFLDAAGELPELWSLAGNYFYFMELPEEETAFGPAVKSGDPMTAAHITASHVYFSYPNANSPTLQDICLSIQKGEHIAIVGENGSGKTTLTKVLMGIYPASTGKISWKGQPLKQANLHSLYQHISVVTQSFVKYYLSVRENVGMSDTNRMDDTAKMHELLKEVKFPENINLEEELGVEFGGSDLSYGQWQKLAIARGLFKPYDFIVMDEPTSALDAVTEEDILNSFLKAMKGKTALVVTHRMSICPKADRIFVMKKGRLIESGSHRELMKQRGEYARLYELQAEWYR